MRTLKKTLALVLVLAMMFSLCITASADFSDDADIENAKAVATLVNLGVIDGMGDGSFNPAGTLTRAQAAKIIACLHGVGEFAKDGAATGFSDVPASHWASGYIAYCVEAGIVDGMGDGTFAPAAQLTGYQWTKMLLCALGYDSAVEGYTGSAWQIAVAKDAVVLGLWKGADADNKAAISRDDACQYAYNVLNQTAVKANYLIGEFAGYTELNAFDVENLAVNVYEIARNYDELGRPYASVEIYDFATDKTAVAYEGEMDAVLTYTAGVKADKIKKDLGLATKDFGKADLGWFEGAEMGKGVLVEVYEMDNKDTDKVTEYYVNAIWTDVKVLEKADITKYAAATDTKDEVKASINLGNITVSYEDGTEETYALIVYTDAYAEGDVVLYNVGWNEKGEPVALNVAKAASETVKVTAKGAGYVKAGSDKYEFDAYCAADLAIGGEYVLYLDQYGYIKAVDTVKAAPTAETLVYVVAYYGKNIPAVPAQYDAYGQLIKGTGVAAYVETYAQGVGVDGKEISYLVATDAKDVVAGETGLQAVAYNKETKLYELSAAKSATQITINKKAISDGNYYYNAADIINMVGALDKLTIGDAAIADLDGKTVWAVYEEVKGTANFTVTKIFAWAEAPAVADPDQLYAIAATGAAYAEESTITYTDKAGKEVTESVYTYEVYLNGEKTTIQTYAAALARDFYSYIVDEHGIYVLTEIDGYEGDVLNLYGNYATFEGLEEYTNYDITGIKVVDLTKDGNGTIEVGETVAFWATLDKDGKVVAPACIYITASVVAE